MESLPTCADYSILTGVFPVWLTHVVSLFTIAADDFVSFVSCVEQFLWQLGGCGLSKSRQDLWT
jgi:hypothetical protein